MKALPGVLLTIVLTTGCVSKPCRPNTLFLAIEYGSAGAPADTLEVSLAYDGETATPKTISHVPGVSSGTFEITFPNGYQPGRTLSVTLTAIAGGNQLVTHTDALTLSASCTTATIRLDTGLNQSDDMSLTDDMSTAGDMAVTYDMQSSCPSGQSCVYVAANGPSCPTGTGAGTMGDPYCRIQTGLNFGNGKTIIILGGSYSEALSLTPSAAYTTTAVAYGATMQAPGTSVLVLGNTGDAPVSVTLDGWNVVGSKVALSCSTNSALGSLKLTVRRSHLSNNLIGIGGTSCDLTVDSSTIGPNNSGGGIGLDRSDFTVVNTVITKNGTAGTGGSNYGGFYHVGNFNRGLVINSTFVNNVCGTGALPPAGVACGGTPLGSAAYFVLNTVMFGNVGDAGEINSVCNPSYTAYAGGSGNNPNLTSCTAAQLFVDATTGNLHPKSGSTAPCSLIDTGVASLSMTSAPSVDFDGVMRPMRGGFDIGAFEAQ